MLEVVAEDEVFEGKGAVTGYDGSHDTYEQAEEAYDLWKKLGMVKPNRRYAVVNLTYIDEEKSKNEEIRDILDVVGD